MHVQGAALYLFPVSKICQFFQETSVFRAYPIRNERIFQPLSEISSVDSEEGHTLFPILPKVTKG